LGRGRLREIGPKKDSQTNPGGKSWGRNTLLGGLLRALSGVSFCRLVRRLRKPSC
jgi:hypothetical protein